MSRDKIFKVLCCSILLWSATVLPTLVSFAIAICIVIAIAGLEGVVLIGRRKFSNWMMYTYAAVALVLVLTRTYELTLLGAAILGGIISFFFVASYLSVKLLRKKGRFKKLLNTIPFIYLLISGCISIVIFQHEYKKFNTNVYNADIIMSIEGQEVPFGEFLLYASNVYQNYNAAYGTGIWAEVVTDEEGNEFTFEEQTKQVIIEQIRLTKLLFEKKEEYNISLSDDEMKLLNKDANEYFQGLSSTGSTDEIVSKKNVEDFYIENAISQKVYNKIIKNVDVSNLSDEEAENIRVEAFKTVYDTITEELNPNWSYEKDVNMEALVEISFASLADSNKISAEGITDANAATPKEAESSETK